MLGAGALMLLFEWAKQLLFPQITLWHSHIATIVFATGLALSATLTLGRNQASRRWIPGLAMSVMSSTAIVMTLFEAAKQSVFPQVTLWESHLATVAFTVLMALGARYFARHVHASLAARVDELVGELRMQVVALEAKDRALQESQEKFTKAFQAGPDCLAITDLETGRVLEINNRFEEITGYKTEEIIGRSGWELGLYDDVASCSDLLTRFKSNGSILDHVHQLRRKSGELATVSVSAVPIEIGGQKCAFAVYRDVTLKQMAEEALRNSEEKFAKAFDASPDSVVILDCATQKIMDVNQGFERVTGYSRREALGRTTDELNLWVDASERERLREAMESQGCVREMEHHIRRKSGEIVVLIGSGEFIEIGGRKCLLTVNRDITAQKAAEEATRQAEAKYRDLVENANDIIFTVDPDGFCMSMNRRGLEIAGDLDGHPRGINLQQLVAPEHAELAWQQLQRVLAGEAIKPFEVDVVSRGNRIKFELSVRPVLENGVAVAAQGIARDVTERRELENQLRQAIKMEAVGRLAAGVAHDFNNLLTVILGNCEAALPELCSSDPLREAIVDIQTSAERAASLTAQLLAFSRKQIVKPKLLNLNDVILEIQRLLKRVIGEDIHLDFCPDERLWKISADTDQIHQIVMNLAVNARDAMPRGGRLTLETRNVVITEVSKEHSSVVPGEYVIMSITDTGTGMDAAIQARIFEPFFTTKTIGRGTGLGLATVYGIVKQNDGHIWVDSEPGRGTTFTVYFPRVQDETVPVVNLASEQAAIVGSGENIVLAEDEKPLRDLVTRHLSNIGYTVNSARDANECLEICAGRDRAPDLLITDVVMPGMSGSALADGLRVRFPELKVLYLSGYSDEALLRRGILPEGTYFVQKPFTLNALAHKVREILDEARKVRW